jgi:TRAP-type mannitol/chloroaromatic compound transport system substrate-binding protein
MDRRSLIRNAGIAGVLATGIAPAVHAQAAIRWRLASSFPKSLDTLYGGAETFAKSVRAMSGGKFEISTHAAGELMPAFGVVDAVQNSTVEMAQTAPYYFFGKDESFSLGTAIPFGLNSRQMSAWMYEGNGLKLMREFYAKYNIVNLPSGNTGAQMGGWFRKEIKSYDDQKLGFVKVAPNYYYPGFWEGSAQLDFFINDKAWNALSPENKAILEAAAAQAHMDIQTKYDARNPVALKQLVASGAKLRAFPQDMMNAAWKTANEVYAETTAKNPGFKKIYDDMVKFRADQNLWFRFTEGTFDRFMQAQKL